MYCDFLFSLVSNDQESPLNNQNHRQRINSNLNNVLVNNNLNLGGNIGGTGTFVNSSNLFICNGSPNNAALASSSASPASSTSTLQGTAQGQEM